MKTGYLIKRANAEPLIISQFQNPKTSESWDPMEKFRWDTAETPQAGEIENIDRTLFSQIDAGIDRWIQDAKYFPRLFLSAGAFLVIYFALSFAVRDPIPVIDEFIAGAAGAVAVWFFMEKKARRSDASIKRRLELKQRISEAEIVISHEMSGIENWIDDLGSLSVLEIADCIVRCNGSDLKGLELPAGDFPKLLFEQVQLRIGKLMDQLPRIEHARMDTDANIPLNGFLVQAGQKSASDLVLLALAVKVKEIASVS